MSDTSLNKYLAQGDDAAEGSFTPDPVTGTTPGQAVLFVNNETPSSPVLKWWNGSAFVPVGGGGSGGAVVQIVNTQTGAAATGSTQIPGDDTIPQNTEGDEYMTLSVTPTSGTNRLKIDVVIFLANNTASRRLTAALFQDSIADALAAGTATASANNPFTVVFSHVMTAGTTSSTTFKVRAGASGTGTTTFNGVGGVRQYGGITLSSITITEYAP